MRVVTLILQQVPHYRASFLKKLQARLNDDGIRLQVLYGLAGQRASGAAHLQGEKWAHEIPTIAKRWLSVDVVWQSCWPQLIDSDLIVVEQSNRLLLNYLLQLRRPWSPTRLAYWGHGRNWQAHHQNMVREQIKRHLVCSVDWWFAYTERTAAYVRSRGFDPTRITVVNNAGDEESLRAGLDACHAFTRGEVKQQLGCGTGPVALYCGTLAANKRLDFLLDAARRVRVAIPSFELLIVGDGPDRDRIASDCRSHTWMHYAGPAYGAERARYWYAADVALMPGPVGLVIVDSFTAQCPLITVNGEAHGPEIAYLQSGSNGISTRDSIDAYADGVTSLLNDRAKINALRAQCSYSARRYSLDAMVENFASGVVRSLDAPLRTTAKKLPVRESA
jgi:glycosyltransferase involved in cell wall biosynthesis